MRHWLYIPTSWVLATLFFAPFAYAEVRHYGRHSKCRAMLIAVFLWPAWLLSWSARP